MKKILVTYAVKEEFAKIDADGNKLIYVETGVGKTVSTFWLTKKILEEKPDFVLNFGTAGTLNHQIGDIFIATHFVDRDYETIQLPGIEYEISSKQLLGKHPQLSEWISTYPKHGICNTGDTFVSEVSSSLGDFVDMEAFAQAYVCRELGIPFLSVKYITDIIGNNSIQHWENKLVDARKGLTQWFTEQKLLSMI